MKTMALLLFFFVSQAKAYILPLDKIFEQMCKNSQITKKFERLSANGEKLTTLNDPATYILGKFLTCKPETLKKYLTELKVDLNTISLVLAQSEPYFVIGANHGEDKPQLWVHKNTFLPAKEIVNGRTTSFKWNEKKLPSLINTEEAGLTTSIAFTPKETP